MFWLELIPEDNQKITQHKKDRVATCIVQQGELWFFSWNWHWDNLRDPRQSNPTQSRKLESSLTLRLMSEFHHLQHCCNMIPKSHDLNWKSSCKSACQLRRVDKKHGWLSLHKLSRGATGGRRQVVSFQVKASNLSSFWTNPVGYWTESWLNQTQT